jgi:hypothetical protein
MDFIGHSTIRRAAPEAAPPKPETATVRIWGEAKDAVQVDGPLEGCKAYVGTDEAFELVGENASAYVRVRYEPAEYWQITVGLGEHKELLPVRLGSEQGPSTITATVEGVSQIIHEQD